MHWNRSNPGPLAPATVDASASAPGEASRWGTAAMEFNPIGEWQLWQLIDSAFPTGGFAHSGGTEAARHRGELRDRQELAGWIEANLRQTERGTLPLVTAAHREPQRLEEWDRLCDAFTLNHVANRASRLQGRALATNVEKIFNLRVGRLTIATGTAAGSPTADPDDTVPVAPFAHLAPIFGAILGRLGVPEIVALRVYVFQQLRSLLASAVRLSIVGPLEGQALQWRFAARAEAVIQRGATLTLDDLAQTCPLVDLLGSTHDQLDARLFQS